LQVRIVSAFHVYMNNLSSRLFTLSRKIRKKLLKEEVFQSYKEALEKCSIKAYENENVISLVKAKAKAYRENIAKEKPLKIKPGVIALLELTKRVHDNGEQIIIFDFGGADGIYYLQLRKCLPPEKRLLWCVIETAEMASEMKEFETSELKFFTSVRDALSYSGNPPHIFHTSSAVQYTPDPLFFIREICNSGAAYLVFNRQSITRNDKSIISIQTSLLSWHGEGDLPKGFVDRVIKYPHTNVPKSEFEKTILEKYNVLYTYEDSSGIKTVNKEDIMGLCYVCESKLPGQIV